MSPFRKDAVVRAARESGLDVALFEGWDGTELALYADAGGRSRDLEVAQRIAREKAARGDWILDLGNRAMAVPSTQGTTLKDKLDALGIQYATGSQAVQYRERVLKQARGAALDYEDVFTELAKR